VANGRFDAFVQNGGLSLWDVAAAGLIAERAGARVTDLAGRRWWDGSRRGATVSIVAAPARHHGELLSLLASVGTEVRTRR
jgi:fructose-1,6-bisphosphatase/inositol monophosphatase family enzyme